MSDGPIDRNPDILGGTPVFTRTRVPVRILMEYLEAGDRLDDFLQDFPSVSRDKASGCWNGPGQSSPASRMRLLLDESVPRPLRMSFPAA